MIMDIEPHPFFERRGEDLFGRVRVGVADAVLGTELEVDLLDGKEKIKIPPGTQPGHLIVLRRRGMPSLRGGRRGDLYLELVVEIPEKLSHEEKKLFKELARLQSRNGQDGNRLLPRKGTDLDA